jgi:hypothetical protein
MLIMGWLTACGGTQILQTMFIHEGASQMKQESEADYSATERCHTCRLLIPEYAKFCPECGALQTSPPTGSSKPFEKNSAVKTPRLAGKETELLRRLQEPRIVIGIALVGIALVCLVILVVMIVWQAAGKQRESSIVSTPMPVPVDESSLDSTPVLVPVVSCKPDGQIGQVGSKTISSTNLSISPQVAKRMAYFKGLGILVPRDWYCSQSSGTSGSVMYLTPERTSNEAISSLDSKGFTGPVIVLAEKSGGTSGRFEVAQAIARAFPTHMSFARGVFEEGLLPAKDIPSGPSPTDKLTYFGYEHVEFITPANTEGFGTDSGLQKNASPIRGVAILEGEYPDLIKLTVRLSPDDDDLAQVIVKQFEKQQKHKR